MALKFDRVKPGDLVTANLINSILGALESLDSRIGEGSDGSVVITGLIPPGPIQVSTELKILGRNFEFSLGAQRVFFDNLAVSAFKLGSNDTQLIVDVPTLPNLPTEGRQVTVTVANSESTDAKTITVQPRPQPVIGDVAVRPDGVQPDPITPGSNADFAYALTSGANLPAVFDLRATISGVPWQDRIQILDSNKQGITEGRISLVPRVPVNIFVRISPVPSGSAGTNFSLAVNVASGNVVGTSGTQSYTIGQPEPPRDETITLGAVHVNPPSAISGDIITLRSNEIAHIIRPATFTVQGTYQISVSLVAPTVNWTLRIFDPTPDPNTQTQGTLTIPSGTTAHNLDFALQPQLNASEGQVEFRIQRQGNTLSRIFRLRLQPQP